MLANRQRLGDAGAFDQEVIEPPFLRERPDFGQKVVPQRAADAAIGHLHQAFVGAREVGAALTDQGGVDVHLTHVVDDHGDASSLAVVENVVQQRGLAGTEEAGKDGDGETVIALAHRKSAM